jgi:hypothetical protein
LSDFAADADCDGVVRKTAVTDQDVAVAGRDVDSGQVTQRDIAAACGVVKSRITDGSTSATSDVVAESKRAKCGVGAAAIGSRSGCSRGPNSDSSILNTSGVAE